MEAEKERLNSIAEKVRKDLENAPIGSLRIGKSQGCVQYYHCTEENGHNGTYISKKQEDFVRQLAQKSYNKKIFQYTTSTLKQLDKLLKIYDDDKIEKIYKLEHPERQKLIKPVEPTHDQRLEKWLEIPFEGKGFGEATPIILTNNGGRVRSKSEKILADYFDSLGIKYKYECPLYLNSYGIVYPDFTFLSPKTGEEIYWEHEGMMDNTDYARAAIKKLETYMKNGIFPGENLILTYETSAYPLNTEMIKILVNRYLL